LSKGLPYLGEPYSFNISLNDVDGLPVAANRYLPSFSGMLVAQDAFSGLFDEYGGGYSFSFSSVLSGIVTVELDRLPPYAGTYTIEVLYNGAALQTNVTISKTQARLTGGEIVFLIFGGLPAWLSLLFLLLLLRNLTKPEARTVVEQVREALQDLEAEDICACGVYSTWSARRALLQLRIAAALLFVCGLLMLPWLPALFILRAAAPLVLARAKSVSRRACLASSCAMIDWAISVT